MRVNTNHSRQGRQWLLSLLLGSAFYAAYQGTVHFSDWCYLAAATATAACASALMLPLNKWLLKHLSCGGQHWPVPFRWAWLLGGTLALFGLANLLTLPLLTWLGPGGTWPWGVAALLVAGVMHHDLLRQQSGVVLPRSTTAEGA